MPTCYRVGGLAAVAVMLTLPLADAADVETPVLSHVGFLLGPDDLPLNELVDLTITLSSQQLDRAGENNRVWSHKYEGVRVSAGHYTLVVGDIAKGPPLDFGAWNGQTSLWLGVGVNGGSELVPRMRYAPAPQSINATNSAHLGGRPASAYLLAADAKATGTINDVNNPLEWSKLKNVPSGIATGNTLGGVVASGGLEGAGTAANPVRIAPAGLATAMLGPGAIKTAGALSGDGTVATPIVINPGSITPEMLVSGVATGAQGSTPIEFGTGLAGKDLDAGKIGYQTFSPDALDIVGAGTSSANRKIKLWAEGGLTISGPVEFPLELVATDDSRVVRADSWPGCASCGNTNNIPANVWTTASSSWGRNRFSPTGLYNSGADDSDQSAFVELKLAGNTAKSVLMSHLDWSSSRWFDVYLSLDDGVSYTFSRRFFTYRAVSQQPYLSTIRTIASNLPTGTGANVRVRVVAARGRLHFEGFALARFILPESLGGTPRPFGDNFTATGTAGCVSLSVFTDIPASGRTQALPGGLLSYSWDASFFSNPAGRTDWQVAFTDVNTSANSFLASPKVMAQNETNSHKTVGSSFTRYINPGTYNIRLQAKGASVCQDVNDSNNWSLSVLPTP